MSADLLREAAAAARVEWGPEAKTFPHAARIHLAVADWLDSEANAVRPQETHDLCGLGCSYVASTAVARAYLGRDS